jgi:hypothetical protein
MISEIFLLIFYVQFGGGLPCPFNKGSIGFPVFGKSLLPVRFRFLLVLSG